VVLSQQVKVTVFPAVRREYDVFSLTTYEEDRLSCGFSKFRKAKVRNRIRSPCRRQLKALASIWRNQLTKLCCFNFAMIQTFTYLYSSDYCLNKGDEVASTNNF